MDIPAPQIKNLENISNHFDEVTKHPQFGQVVFESLEGLTQTIMALLDENGKTGWTKKAVNNDGNPMFEANEGEQFEKQVQPFLPMILKFFDRGELQVEPMRGGGLTRDRFTEIKSEIGRIRNTLTTEPTQELKNTYTKLYNELQKAIPEMDKNANVNHGLTEEVKAFVKDLPNPSTVIVAQPLPQQAQQPQTTEQQLREQLAAVQAEKNALEKKLQASGKIDKPFSLDRVILDTVKKIYKMDEVTKKFASENMGILKFEQDYDRLALESDDPLSADPKPFAVLRPIPYVGPVLAEIPVPARLLVLIVYTVLDVSRVLISVSPTDSPMIRSVLSILLAVADFLKGSWKKAILSFVGVFGKNYVIAGVFGKLFLDIIGLIGPDLQLKMVLGTVDVIKSMTAGVLLQIYQVTALAFARKNVLEGLNEIADLMKKNMDILGKVEGIDDEETLPNFLIPSFSDIQNLQAVVAHDALVCTTQFQNAIDKMMTTSQGRKSSIMRFILEFLMRIPVDSDAIKARCPNMPVKSEEQPSNQPLNVNNPLNTTGQQTYSQTATEESVRYAGLESPK